MNAFEQQLRESNRDDVLRIDPATLGRTIAYDAGTAGVFDSIPAAILWRHLSWLSNPAAGKTWCECPADPQGWFAYALQDAHDHLGFSVGMMRSARATLDELGLIQTTRRGMPVKLFWRLNRVRFAELMNFGRDAAPGRSLKLPPEVGFNAFVEMDLLDSQIRETSGMRPGSVGFTDPSIVRMDLEQPLEKPPAAPVEREPTGAGEQQPLLPKQQLTIAEVLAGKVDAAPMSLTKGPPAARKAAEEVALAVVAEWAKIWGMRRATLTRERRAVWQRWCDDRRVPSDVVKAIRGMTFDTSKADRSVYNEWSHVDNGFDGFIKRYELAMESGAKPVWPRKPDPAGCRRWEGIWIPNEYRPDQRDKDKIAEGLQVFIIADSNWADFTHDPSGRIAAQDAKHGVGFNYPPQRVATRAAS